MTIDQLQTIYEKLQRKKHVWHSIIKAIETAINKLRNNAKTSSDRIVLSSINTQIAKAHKEHNYFESKLKQIKTRIEYNINEYYDIKKELNNLNNEAQLAIKQLREIAKDIVDINHIKSTTSNQITSNHINSIHAIKINKRKRNRKPPKPPTPPSTDSEISNKYKSSSSSPSSTMIRQKSEIAEIRHRIKQLRNALPQINDNKNDIEISPQTQKSPQTEISPQPELLGNKYSETVISEKVCTATSNNNIYDINNINDDTCEQRKYLIKLDECGNQIQNDLNETWNVLDQELNKNAMSTKLIGDELKKLQKKLNQYQEIVKSAADLCRNSVEVITDKNQDLTVILSEKRIIEKKWRENKKELDNMKNTNLNVNKAWKEQCDLNDELQKENANLRNTLMTIQDDHQIEIDKLKDELNDVRLLRVDGFPPIDLDTLLKKLEIEDDNVKKEILLIMESYRKQRKNLFDVAASKRNFAQLT